MSRIIFCLVLTACVLGPGRASAESAPAGGITRLPVPAKTALTEAEKTIKDIFKDEYAKTTPIARQALANKLLEQAGESRNDPAARYVLLQESMRLGQLGDDWMLSLRAACELELDYAIEKPEFSNAVFAKASSSAPPAACRDLLAAAEGMSEQAVAGDDYASAVRLITHADSLARRTQDPGLIARMQETVRRTRQLQSEAERVRSARATLETKPDDPDACAAVGRFLALVKNDFTPAMPLLAKGSDAALKAIAEAELATPADATAQVALGDRWYDYATAQAGIQKTGAQSRAARWYREALPNTTGLARAKVEKRLAELAKVPGAAALPQGLIAHWTFRTENITEKEKKKFLRPQVGKKELELVDAKAVPGRGNGAVRFENGGSRIALGEGIKLGEQWTMVASIEFPLGGRGWRTLMFNSPANHHVLVSGDGSLGVFRGGFVSSGYNVSLLKGWHTLAAVAANNQTTFFVDGKQVGTAKAMVNSPLTVFGNYVAGTQPFVGTVDEVLIFERALTPDAILTTLRR